MQAPTWLEVAHYTQGEPFMLEKTQLFAREWLPVCSASQLVNPGDYLGHVIGGWPIAAVRDGGQIRLFRNTCRHQQMMVLDKPSGNCTLIQCRYHGWQYRLDGAFQSAPSLVAPAPDTDTAATDLVALAMRSAAGLLFGHLDGQRQFDPQAPLVEASIVRTIEARASAAPAVTTIDTGCNWKVFIENAMVSGALFHWPLLLMRELPAGVQVIQVVPRSFVRTRVVSYLWADQSAADAATEQAASALAQDKAAGEALQARYAAGELDALSSNGEAEACLRVQAFRQQVSARLTA